MDDATTSKAVCMSIANQSILILENLEIAMDLGNSCHATTYFKPCRYQLHDLQFAVVFFEQITHGLPKQVDSFLRDLAEDRINDSPNRKRNRIIIQTAFADSKHGGVRT